MTENRKIPEWLVERVAQRELTNHEVTSEALQRISASNEEILSRYPARQMVSKIKGRVQSAPRERGMHWLYVAAPVAAALVLALSLGLSSGPEVTNLNNNEPDEVLPKGLSPKLQIYRKHGEVAERLAPNSRAREHDLLQLSYVSAGKPFGVIVSIDGRGTVTRHIPETGSSAMRLNSQGEIALDSAYELDDAPRFECFYFVAAENQFAVDMVLNAAQTIAKSSEAGRPLPLPEGFVQSAILIQKEPQ